MASLLQQIATKILFKAAVEMKVEFSEPQAILKLPEEEIGNGWKLLPLFTPTEASDYSFIIMWCI